MKRKSSEFVVAVIVLGFFLTSVGAREWTAAKDGKKLDAEFVSSADGKVTLKRAADGRRFTVGLEVFTEADRKWVEEKLKKSAEPLTGPFASKLTGKWELADFDGLPYAIFGSPTLDASKDYPLLISLHGRSQNTENGKQVNGWTKLYSATEFYGKHPSIIIAPMGYQPFGGQGTAWNNEPGQKALKLIKELRDELPVDKKRIYVFGHSMGGFGTCHFINSEPRLFAAGVASAGCTGPGSAGSFKRFPLWLFHAADDPIVEVSASRNLAEALKREKQFKYTEYKTGGHAIVRNIIANKVVHEWMFKQARK